MEPWGFEPQSYLVVSTYKAYRRAIYLSAGEAECHLMYGAMLTKAHGALNKGWVPVVGLGVCLQCCVKVQHVVSVTSNSAP